MVCHCKGVDASLIGDGVWVCTSCFTKYKRRNGKLKIIPYVDDEGFW